MEGEDIEMIKKHEQEKMVAMKEDELQIDDEMEAVWILCVVVDIALNMSSSP